MAHDAALAHDDHHGEHKEGFIHRWVMSTNHKDIGTLYLIFSLTMFFIGGAMAMEDALVLADELAHASFGAALTSYHARRLPRIEWVQQRTRAWVQRLRSGERVTDPAAIYRQDYAFLLEEP